MQVRRERVLLLVLLCAVIVVWWLALASASSCLTITVIDVGQGDSILIQSPSGMTMLIDGGGVVGQNPGGRDIGREVVVPALLAREVKKIDVLLATHPHEDHTGGLPAVLKALPVGLVLDPMLPEQTEPSREIRRLVAEKKIPLHRATEGQQINLGSGVLLEVLNPPDPRLVGEGSSANNNSTVMRLTYGKFSMLFAADIEELGATHVARLGDRVRCTVLKVPHHGSAKAARTSFFQIVHPQLALISVGANNEFGHPAPSTLEALERVGAHVMRTDQDGAITLRVDQSHWRAIGYVGKPTPKQYSGPL